MCRSEEWGRQGVWQVPSAKRTLPVPPPGRRPGSFRRETGGPSPASLRSATSPPWGHFGSYTPYTCPRGFAAPSPASRLIITQKARWVTYTGGFRR